MSKFDPVISTRELISLVAADGTVRTIQADGHSEDHIAIGASIIRPFGDGAITIKETDRTLYVGSPDRVGSAWTIPADVTWYTSATVVTVFQDGNGDEVGRSASTAIPPEG